MRVLVIGSGGREHALVWKIRQSPSVSEVYCAPGNPGIGGMARLVPVSASQLRKLRDVALAEKIDLTVVGPEQPLADGIVDLFEESGLTVFGPSKAAARLEWSKSFAKEFMSRHRIPTARYRIFGADQLTAAEQFVMEADYPLVLKADGLAAGKGVLVCGNRDEGLAGVRDIMKEKVFGDAGSSLLVEEFLTGVEASLFILSDGRNTVTLIPAQDYK
ncbi:MAG: phosphoribosylamine--glycine ligase, partial [Ignavibacteria bacterium]|nr:phosphoribosylamine--glycine ligase [Ignavibacteria bacterium]